MAKITALKKKNAGATPAKKKAESVPAKLKEIDDDIEGASDDDLDDDDLEGDDVSDIDDDDLEEADDDDDDDDLDEDDDDDDDDEEGGDDDDDSDDDEEEENDEAPGNKKMPLLVKKAALAKNNAKAANKKSPVKNEKPQTPASAKKRQNNSQSEQPAKKFKADGDNKRESRDEQDKRTLYIKGFTDKTTNDALKALSPDIINVRRPRAKGLFAFLEFETEESAEKNHKILQSAKLEDRDLYVDYAGTKSSNKRVATKKQDFKGEEKNKLFVGGLNEDTTEEELEKAFPNSTHVVFKKGKPNTKSFAFVSFDTEDNAKKFVDAEVVVGGNQEVKPRLAMAPRPKPDNKGNNFRPRPPQGKNPRNMQQKVKFVKKNKKNMDSD